MLSMIAYAGTTAVLFGLAVWGMSGLCTFNGYVDNFSVSHVRDSVIATSILFFGAGVLVGTYLQ